MLKRRQKKIYKAFVTIGVAFSIAFIGCASGKDAFSATSSLSGYTPPPMFGENKSRPIKIPENNNIQTPENKIIKKPSVEELLGYKDMSYAEKSISGLPVPRRKPEYISQLAHIRHMSKSMPAVKKAEVKKKAISEPGVPTISPSRSGDPVTVQDTNLLEPVRKPEVSADNRPDMILNEASLDVLPDKKRRALVDMILIPADRERKQENEQALKIVSADTHKKAGEIENKSEVISQKPDGSDQARDAENRPGDVSISGAGKEQGEDSRQMASLSNKNNTTTSLKNKRSPAQHIRKPDTLRPPQHMLDDVASEDRMSEELKLAAGKFTRSSPSSGFTGQVTGVSDVSENGETKKDNVMSLPSRLASIEPASAPDPQTKSGIENNVSENHKRNGFELSFKPGDTELSQKHKRILEQDLIENLNNRPSTRIEIKSYAMQVDDTQSGARRISLARALAVRQFLLSQGIKPQRMDLRALGENSNGSPKDRIDITLKQG